METLQHILCLIIEGMWMTNLDLLDAFLTVPMAKKFQKLLKFEFEGKLYKYVCLPFGYTDSPRVFTKILWPVVAKLCSQGHTLTFYLDDSWQGAHLYKSALHTCLETYSLLMKVGFLQNTKKSSLKPSQTIQILGTCIDSVNMIVFLPPEKKQNIHRFGNKNVKNAQYDNQTFGKSDR